MHARLQKTPTGFSCADPETEEWWRKLRPGSVVHGEFRQARNPAFHRKYFALLKVGFDNWEPEIDASTRDRLGLPPGFGPQKDFDRFRRDITILCGHWHYTVRLDGSLRIEADSISFASMSPEEFERLYQQTITVFVEKIYAHGISETELRETVDRYLQFA